jgi:hypothetical protein
MPPETWDMLLRKMRSHLEERTRVRAHPNPG